MLSKEIDTVRQPPVAAARAPAQGGRADRRAGRLHQRRQDDAVQPVDRRRRRGVERAVRDARSAGAPRQAAGSPRAARVRHGRLHRSPAALAGRGVSRDARGGGRSGPAAARHRRGRCRIASGGWRPSHTVLEEVGATAGAVRSRSSTSAISSAKGSARASTALYPGALCVSALTGEGREEVIAAMETRLALDTSPSRSSSIRTTTRTAQQISRAVSLRPHPAARRVGDRQ